jgi:hypothetical protein
MNRGGKGVRYEWHCRAIRVRYVTDTFSTSPVRLDVVEGALNSPTAVGDRRNDLCLLFGYLRRVQVYLFFQKGGRDNPVRHWIC